MWYFAGSKCVRSFLRRGIFQPGALLELKIQAASELSLSFPKYGAYADRIPKHSFNSSSIEEDDFSELDSPVPEGAEKPKEFQNVTGSEKIASSAHLQRTENPAKNDSPPGKGKPFPALSTALVNCTGSSTTEKDTKNFLKCTNSNSVTIEKVPSTVSRKQLRKAVSEFGEISNASARSGPDGFISYDVEFKTMESKERAVASGWIIVNLSHLPIRSLNAMENITIRISNISSDTAEPLIHSTCMLCGPVAGLSRINNTSVDVVYGVNSYPEGEAIVKKLHAACAGESWSIELLREHREKAVTDITAGASKVQQEAGSDLINLLEDVQRQYELKKMYTEDLVKMHQAVVHLHNRPTC